jgi:hypothetical protein
MEGEKERILEVLNEVLESRLSAIEGRLTTSEESLAAL